MQFFSIYNLDKCIYQNVYINLVNIKYGRSGIRTHGMQKHTTAFETASFGHSDIRPY